MSEEITKEIKNIDKQFSEIVVNGDIFESSNFKPKTLIRRTLSTTGNQSSNNQQSQQSQQNQTVGESVQKINLNNTLHDIEDPNAQEAVATLELNVNTLQSDVSSLESDVSSLQSDVEDIQELIPAQASETNKLADKDFVNSTVGTNTANYISNNGQPFTSVAQLEAYSGTVTNNDYAIVTGTDEEGNTFFDRYKATVSGTSVSWGKEYRLNNSSFTAQQWETINSGITALLVQKLENVEAGAEVNTIESISVNGSPVNPDSNRNVNLQVGGGDVESVNGQTGVVVLNASDVGATPKISSNGFSSGALSFKTTDITINGYVGIKFDTSIWSNSMLSFKVRVTEYEPNTVTEFLVRAYPYSDTNRWYSADVVLVATNGSANWHCWFGADGSGNGVILIAKQDGGSDFSYPQVDVYDFSGGYYGVNYDFIAHGQVMVANLAVIGWSDARQDVNKAVTISKVGKVGKVFRMTLGMTQQQRTQIMNDIKNYIIENYDVSDPDYYHKVCSGSIVKTRSYQSVPEVYYAPYNISINKRDTGLRLIAHYYSTNYPYTFDIYPDSSDISMVLIFE